MSVTLRRDPSGRLRHRARIGRHTLIVDEPEAAGGEDAGPSPHDLYDAALGACMALTLVWYAGREGLALTEVEVRIDRDASDERNGCYRLRATIRMAGRLGDADRQRLLAVAARCPVHRLMTQTRTEIETLMA
ncbi:MAG: OsmC family protein [Rhodocyclaceae bacterium]|nr:OsmC family protein [Rhodocyclaceae bacterium]